MDKQLLLARDAGALKLAALEDGQLVELLADAADTGALIGNIYVGRVDNALSGMDAAFVDIGIGQNGLLSDADGAAPAGSLRPGTPVLVQVLKQPDQGKGPRLTRSIALPGRMVVLTPTVAHTSISKKIGAEPERRRLLELAKRLCPDGMGLIVRTAADGADEAALAADVGELLDTWREIERIAPHRRPPSLLHSPPGLAQRTVRDLLRPDVTELVVEGSELYAEALASAAPDQRGRIRLHASDVPLLALHRVGAQLERAAQRQVWLPSGGGITFDYTEALTVVDVNSGKYTGKTSLEDTALRINCEAAVELCRQLRLRDIGGIVIVDFIDMGAEEHRCELLNLLAKELRRDRMKTNLLGMTKLGLVELTRKKDRSGLIGARAICPVCKGTGRVERKKEPQS